MLTRSATYGLYGPLFSTHFTYFSSRKLPDIVSILHTIFTEIMQNPDIWVILTYLLTYLLTYILTYLLTYILTYSLTPRCTVLLEQLTGLQLVKKFPAFRGTRRFITALTSVRHLSLS